MCSYAHSITLSWEETITMFYYMLMYSYSGTLSSSSGFSPVCEMATRCTLLDSAFVTGEIWTKGLKLDLSIVLKWSQIFFK